MKHIAAINIGLLYKACSWSLSLVKDFSGHVITRVITTSMLYIDEDVVTVKG